MDAENLFGARAAVFGPKAATALARVHARILENLGFGVPPRNVRKDYSDDTGGLVRIPLASSCRRCTSFWAALFTVVLPLLLAFTSPLSATAAAEGVSGPFSMDNRGLGPGPRDFWAASNSFVLDNVSGVAHGMGGSNAFVVDTRGFTGSVVVSPGGTTDFGSVGTGQASASRAFVVRNDTGFSVSVRVTAPPPFAVTANGVFDLPAGASNTVTVRFQPSAAGRFTTALRFDAGTALSVTRQVTGLGLAGPGTEPTGVLRGTVTRTDTGRAVGGVVVTAAGVEFESLANGSYALYGLPSGTRVTVEASPRPDLPNTGDLRGRSITNVLVPAAGEGTLNIGLEPSGVGPAPPPPTAFPVVLVRGRGASRSWAAGESAHWAAMRNALAAQGFTRLSGRAPGKPATIWDCNEPDQAFNSGAGFVLNGEMGIEWNATRLRQYVEAKALQYRADAGRYPQGITIVAHSMGGLTTRAAFGHAGGVNMPDASSPSGVVRVPVRRVFMLATPHAGTVIADPVPAWFPLPGGNSMQWWNAQWQSTQDLKTDRMRVQFATEHWRWNPSMPLRMVAGVPATATHGDLEAGRSYMDKFYSLVGLASERPNDGSVTQASADGRYWTRDVSFWPPSGSVRENICFAHASPTVNVALDHYDIRDSACVAQWVAAVAAGAASPTSDPGCAVSRRGPRGDDPATTPSQQMELAGGAVATGETIEVAFPSDAVSALTVDCRASRPGVNLRLRRPGGTIITPATTDAGTTYSSGESDETSMTWAGYVIDSPEPGLWTALVDGTGLPPGSQAAWCVSAGGASTLAMAPEVPAWLPAGGEGVVACRIADSATASVVTGAACSVSIAAPNGTTATLDLFDDGQHADGAANDGLYANYMTTTVGGSYALLFRADGTDGAGMDWRRVATAGVDVSTTGGGIMGNLAHEVTDTDGDGTSDVVRLRFAVTVETTGTYRVSGRLDTLTGDASLGGATDLPDLPAGVSVATLTFDRRDLPPSKWYGPWVVRDLSFFDKNGSDTTGRRIDRWDGIYEVPGAIINPLADVRVSAAVVPPAPVVGQNYTVRLTVVNDGPDTATLVTAKGYLPAGAAYVGASASQGTTARAGSVVTAELGRVNPGTTATVDIAMVATAPGELATMATVATAATDPDDSDNFVQTTATVIASANLSVSKSAAAATVVQDEPLTYTIIVSNLGPAAADDVQLTDTLPAGVVFSSSVPTPSLIAGSALSWSMGTIPAGGTSTVTLVVSATTVGQKTNTVATGSSTFDPNAGNNAASVQVQVEPKVDLSIAKVDDLDPVFVGQTLTYTVTVSNTSLYAAQGVVVTDILPAEVEFLSTQVSAGSAGELNGVVTWNAGTLAAGGNAAMTVRVRPQAAGTITNTVSVTAATADPVLANNSDSEQTTVDPIADLSVSKSGSPDPVRVNGVLTYSLGVRNLGPSGATSVTLVDTLSTQVEYLSSVVTQGSVGHVGGVVTANLGTLAADASATVTVMVKPRPQVPAPGSNTWVVTNAAGVTAAEPDPVPGNNTAAIQTMVLGGFLPWADDTFDTGAIAAPGSQTGWSSFGMTTSTLGWADYESSGGAYRAHIAARSGHYRLSGVIANRGEWMPYSSVGTGNHVRAKFHVYAGGQANASALNQVPNMRLRLQTRYAQNSMLEVYNHLNSDPEATALSRDLVPSRDPLKPSVYRVDFDPVDVPFLVTNGVTEGIQPAFEAYSTDPQDNGYLGLTELELGIYPAPLPGASTPVKVYATSASDAGDLKLVSASDRSHYNYVPGVGEGAFGTAVFTGTIPASTESTAGVTIDSRPVASGTIGVAVVNINPDRGTDNHAARVRVEEGKQYRVRFHLTSTQQSNRQPQIRLRARSVKFNWSQKIEMGGAWAAGAENNTIARQLLPGVGCLNPDKDAGEAGGWYTLVMHSPLDAEIRPEFPDGTPLATRMPNLSAQPGPGVGSPSRRDLLVGFDVIDTLTFMGNHHLEQGLVTLDRVEIHAEARVPD